MIISDEYRGYGIGKLLINSFKEFCRTKNISNIKVVASYKNKNAIEFYCRNGFEEFDITLFKDLGKKCFAINEIENKIETEKLINEVIKNCSIDNQYYL